MHKFQIFKTTSLNVVFGLRDSRFNSLSPPLCIRHPLVKYQPTNTHFNYRYVGFRWVRLLNWHWLDQVWHVWLHHEV